MADRRSRILKPGFIFGLSDYARLRKLAQDFFQCVLTQENLGNNKNFLLKLSSLQVRLSPERRREMVHFLLLCEPAKENCSVIKLNRVVIPSSRAKKIIDRGMQKNN